MMKKESKLITGLRYLCLSFVFVIGLVAIIGTGGCGGGSSSGGSGGGGSTSLADGTFEKYFAPDSSFASQGGPFNTSAYRRYMHIYHASDINGSGYIESIAFRLNSVLGADVTCPNTTIRLGHTSRTEFDGVDNNFASYVDEGKGSLVTLVDDTTVTIPAGSNGDYYILTLDSPFYYNGVDNLVVDVERTTACTDDVSNRMEISLAYRGQLYASVAGPTGGAYSWAQQIQLLFEGGVNAVEFAPLPGNGNVYPFDGLKVQILYDSTLISGSGPITGIAMRTGQIPTTAQSYTFTMRLAHSTLTDLTTDFNSNFSDSPVTVSDNTAFIVPAGIPVGDYIWIPMPDGSFNYNGTDNLIVEIDVIASTGMTAWGIDGIGADDTRAYGASGSVMADGVDNAKYHISFRFNGGTMDVITTEDVGWVVPFTDSFDIRSQILFDAWQLGTGGPVTGISFRLENDSLASDHPAATVVLGHTTNTVLDTTFAANMTDPTTVFTGTLNIPAGLEAGDWFTIPVSGFTYDPTQNLVFEVNQDAGTATNRIFATGVDIPGASGGMSGPKGNPVASVYYSFGQSDIRVHLSK